MSDLLTFKMIVVGDTGVGKSSIITQFSGDGFDPLYKSTVGVTFVNVEMNVASTKIKLQIWDTAGQEIYRSITQNYYRESRLAIVVYDVTKRDTFESLTSWINDIKERAPEYCQLVIVGNKIDLEADVTPDEISAFAESVGYTHYETSAKTGQCIKDLFEGCALAVYTEDHEKKKPSDDVLSISSSARDKKRGKRRCC